MCVVRNEFGEIVSDDPRVTTAPVFSSTRSGSTDDADDINDPMSIRRRSIGTDKLTGKSCHFFHSWGNWTTVRVTMRHSPLVQWLSRNPEVHQPWYEAGQARVCADCGQMQAVDSRGKEI